MFIAEQKEKTTPTKRVCLRLKEARELRQLSLKDLSIKTRISTEHLKAMEACDFSAIPGSLVYRKRFLSSYARALSLPEPEIISQFLNEEVLPEIREEQTDTTPLQKNLVNWPTILRVIAITAMAAIGLSYLIVQINRLVAPPKLTIAAPLNGITVSEREIFIKGETDRESVVTLNGVPVRKNEDGQFEEKITLSPGLNSLTITAEKKHGKVSSETRHVVLTENRFDTGSSGRLR